MKSAYIGVMLGVIGTTSMSLAMNLWKASATMGENELPWYKRTRYLVGVCMALFINPPVDAIAFSMAPLSLIAPLQGLTIALAVLFAALGISGYRESVSRKQWQAIFCCISGLEVCSWYGPNSDSESAWWPLISHYYNPLWVIYCSTAYALGVITIIVQKIPALVRRVSGTMSWTLMLCCGSGLLAGLLQTQLKVFAQVLRSLAFDADVSCRDAPPDFCRYDVDVCPSFSEVYALDPICLFQVHIMGRTIPAYPVHWLIDWNAWALVSSAILQLNMMTSALESNVLSVSVRQPLLTSRLRLSASLGCFSLPLPTAGSHPYVGGSGFASAGTAVLDSGAPVHDPGWSRLLRGGCRDEQPARLLLRRLGHPVRPRHPRAREGAAGRARKARRTKGGAAPKDPAYRRRLSC